MLSSSTRYRGCSRLLSSKRPVIYKITLQATLSYKRTLATETSPVISTKAVGDISSVFPSLSGIETKPLPERFADLKRRIVSGRERELQASWDRLIEGLEWEIEEVRRRGSEVIPSVEFKELSNIPESQLAEIRKRGTFIIRNVIPDKDALRLKEDARNYIRNNPSTRAFPVNSPIVYELYWTPSQLRARSDPALLEAQQFAISLWHVSPKTLISTQYPLTYADRFRIRPPGDAKFALGAHVDGGSLERWEDDYYRGVYEKVLAGQWEEYEPFDAEGRERARMDLYNGAGACKMFRMFQGWLSMSNTGPQEGTLRVNPILRHATAYCMLRPFFSPPSSDPESLRGWKLDLNFTTVFPGSAPGTCQELSPSTHPHLRLEKTMTPLPRVNPGDYALWHCDTIHAVDPEHRGVGDSSVMYIPATPLCKLNAEYLVSQREAFARSTPPPDFPGAGGAGEAGFVGRATEKDIVGVDGKRAFGLGDKQWDLWPVMTSGERAAVEWANARVFGK
ncbi:hypothetical protein RUND412_001562 [Rhizina undulata]